jgi:hypothetical protein
MASPASIHASPRRRCSASSRSRSARGMQSAGREPALRLRRKCPPPEHRGRIFHRWSGRPPQSSASGQDLRRRANS